MAGIKKLRYTQLGRETSGAEGTKVAADFLWMGACTIEDNREIVWPEENVGYLPGTTRNYTPKVEALLHMDEVEATFEQFPHILEASIEREAASADGAGSGYIYEYNPGTTAQTEVATYTVEAGDDHKGEVFTYGFVSEWSLSGVAGEAVMMSAEWIGREVSTQAKTAGISAPIIEEILFSMGKLYIDNATAAFGSTQVVNQWLEFELSYNSGFQAVYTGDGQKYFSFTKTTGAEIELTLKLEHDTAATDEKANWRNSVSRNIRMEFIGSTFATSGTTYSNKELIIDLSGRWDDFDTLDDTDGNDTLTGTFKSRFDPTANHFATITVVNDLSALP